MSRALRRDDPDRQDVQDAARLRALAGKADIGGADAHAPPVAAARCARMDDQLSAGHLKAHETIGRVMAHHSALEAHRRLARGRQRQGKITLEIRQRPRRDDPAMVHQHQRVGQPFDLAQIVADIDNRHGEAGVQLVQKGQDLVARSLIERRQRLVHQQKTRLRQQRAANGDALALAARQFFRRTVEQSVEPEKARDLVEAKRPLAWCRRAIEQIAAHGQMRKQARFLKHIADRAKVWRAEEARILPDLAGNRAGALRRAVQASKAAQHCRLAGPRRPEQGGHAPPRRDEFRIKVEAAEPVAKRGVNAIIAAHAPTRATRFSMSVMARMTVKANTTMPPARRLASRHWPVST